MKSTEQAAVPNGFFAPQPEVRMVIFQFAPLRRLYGYGVTT